MLYALRLAWRSIRRNPVLSILTIGGIALGITVSMMFVTAHHVMSANPIPHKSAALRYVQLDFWNPERPWDDDDPSEPPDQLTWREMAAVAESDIPTYRTGMYKASLSVHPDDPGVRPYRVVTRLCHADFFPMFDVPFRFGGGWDRAADERGDPVVVLDDETNRKIFGGENSVGREVRLEDRSFTVIGVLAPWRPLPKYYDPHNGPFDTAENVYVPIGFGPAMEIGSIGNDSGWKAQDQEGYEGRMASESTWLQVWVQLDDPEQEARFRDWIAGYHAEQAALGRAGRPANAKLRNVMEWLEFAEVVPRGSIALMIISLLFLLVCSINLIGLLLGKFGARAPEVGVRRALGASRRRVFLEHLLECELIGVVGGALGLALSIGGLELLERLFRQDELRFRPDATMLVVALGLALASAFVAGVIPSWQICRVPPGRYLKSR